MMTVEIKVNDRIVEIISIKNIDDNTDETNLDETDYLVNGTWVLIHKRGDGHRKLALKALQTVIRNCK